MVGGGAAGGRLAVAPAGAERKLDVQAIQPLESTAVEPRVCDPDSDESLDALIDLSRSYASYTEREARKLMEYVGELRGRNSWQRRLTGEPKTWERFCIEVLGYAASYFEDIAAGVTVLEEAGNKNPTIEEAHRAKKVKALASQAAPTAPTGRPKKGTQCVPLSKGGNDRRTARIAKRSPEVLARMKAGEFKSVRAAEIAAGIVKVQTPLDAAMKAVAKLGMWELVRVLAWCEERVDHLCKEQRKANRARKRLRDETHGT